MSLYLPVFVMNPWLHSCSQLASVLREVKYLEARQTEAIPETAMQIYTTRGQLWQYVANLELTAAGYNKVSSEWTSHSSENCIYMQFVNEISNHDSHLLNLFNWFLWVHRVFKQTYLIPRLF